jgi:hypothetical protein
MERRFSVEAKSFSFTVNSSRSILRMEEKRKGFGGFLSLGIKCSDWLADTVEEALEFQRKEFARSFRDEVRVLKVRTGSNKAGCFLEVGVFVEGGRKGVIRLLEGRRGWGWQRFVDELQSLIAQLVAKVMLEVPVVNAGVGGSMPSFADVLVAPSSGLKPYVVEAPISVEVCSDVGSHLPLGDGVDSMAALKGLAMEFLVKLRAEVDWMICFGLGFKFKASRDIRKRMGWVFSRMGLKPKLHFGFKLRGRCKPSGLNRRPRPLVDGSRVKANAEVDWVPVSVSSQGEASSEKMPGVSSEKAPEVFLGVTWYPEAAVSESESQTGNLSSARGLLRALGDAVVLGLVAAVSDSRTSTASPASGLLRCSGDVVVLGPAAGPDAVVSASPIGKFAVRDPSPAKGLLQRGFLLR